MKLSEIIDVFIAGDWGNESLSIETPHAISCVRGADIVPISNNEFVNIPLRYVSDRSFQQKLLQVGDIVIEKSGGSPTQSTGRAVYISQALLSASKNVVCSNFCVAFRVKERWNSYFIYQYWQYLYNSGVFFNFEGKTSGIKNLQLDIALSTIEIEPYPIEKQISIANCLEAFEEKIAINRSINHNLEAMAKQLYDYWFVQFDFPNEEGKPYKSNGGEMIYSDALKKYIPKGWTHSPLQELVDLEDSKRIPLSNAQRAERKGEFPYYGATGIMDYIDDFIFDYDILLLAEDGSTSDSNGFPVVQYVWGEVWVNNHAHIILPKDRAHLIYTYFLLKSIPVKMIETGSIQKKISQDNLLGYKAINVPKRLRDIYTERIKPMWEQKKLATEGIIQLTKQRDILLPLLMNGQAMVNYDLPECHWLYRDFKAVSLFMGIAGLEISH